MLAFLAALAEEFAQRGLGLARLLRGELERGADRFTMILEDENVLEATVFLEIKNTVTEGPEHILNALGREISQAGVVVRSFDDDLVRADTVHTVKHALGLAVEVTLDAERGKFIGNYAHRPTRCVALRRRSAIRIRAISLNFRRSLVFVSVAERAKAALQFDSLAREVSRALGAVGRNDYPPAYNWIFSKLRQALILSNECDC